MHKDKKCECGSNHHCEHCGDGMVKEIHKLGGELTKLAKKAMGRYDQSDDKTKKKIIAGIAGTAALVAGVLSIKSHAKKKKNK